MVADADHPDHRAFGTDTDFRANIALGALYLYGFLGSAAHFDVS